MPDDFGIRIGAKISCRIELLETKGADFSDRPDHPFHRRKLIERRGEKRREEEDSRSGNANATERESFPDHGGLRQPIDV